MMRSSVCQWQAQAKPSCLHRDRRRISSCEVPSGRSARCRAAVTKSQPFARQVNCKVDVARNGHIWICSCDLSCRGSMAAEQGS